MVMKSGQNRIKQNMKYNRATCFYRLQLCVGAMVALLSPSIASAHPGHSLHRESLLHTLTSPYHLLTLALLGAALLLCGGFVKRLAARRVMQVTGATALSLALITAVTQMLH